ncbi:hypothetical protein BJX62DRAFT_134548 [Aspergillus germanicus]
MPAIIWSVAINSIVAFEEALVAVRATAIARESFQRLELPPHPFPLDDIDGRLHKPSLDELKSVFKLQRITRYTEVSLLKTDDYIPKDDLIWRERLHRALYRLFLAGAALAGAYHEPFLSNTPHRPDRFLQGYTHQLGQPFDEQLFGEVLTTQDFAYLLQFPIYDFESLEQHHAAFGPLAEFLVSVARRRAHESAINDPELTDFLSSFTGSSLLTDGEGQVLFTETTQLLAAYELVQRVFEYSENTQRTYFANAATIVHFGSFFPADITVPQTSKGGCDSPTVRYHVHKHGPGVPYMGPLDLVLDYVFRESGQPNYYDSTCPVPQPPLQFFHYIYRRYLGLRFSASAFEESKYSPYQGWIANPAVFSDCFAAWSDDLEGTFCADAPYAAFFRG